MLDPTVDSFFEALVNPAVRSLEFNHLTSFKCELCLCDSKRSQDWLHLLRNQAAVLQSPPTMKHSFDKQTWLNALGLNHRYTKEALKYNLPMLRYILQKGPYYLSEIVEEPLVDRGSVFARNLIKHIDQLIAYGVKGDLVLNLSEEGLADLKNCANAFLFRVDPNLESLIAPLLNKQGLPTTEGLERFFSDDYAR